MHFIVQSMFGLKDCCTLYNVQSMYTNTESSHVQLALLK